MLKKFVVSFFAVVMMVGMLMPMGSAAGYDGSKFKYKNLFLEIAPEFTQPADWPEEEPSMIFYQKATLTNNTGGSYDGVIEIPVPAQSKSFRLLEVVELESDDQSSKDGTKLEAEVDTEREVVSFKPTEAIKRGKNYIFSVSTILNPFEDNQVKSFSFDYTPISDGEEVDVTIYAPIGATDVEVDPKVASQELENGEQVFRYHLHDEMRAGKTLTYKMSYTKEGNKTTEAQGGITEPEDTSSGNSSEASADTAVIVAAIIGMSIVIFGIFLFLGLRSRGQQGQEKRPVRTAPTKSVEKKAKKDVEAMKKELRKQFIAGEIDENRYSKEMKKLN